MTTNVITNAAGGVASLCMFVDFFFPGASIICQPIAAAAIAVLGYFANK